MIEFWLLIALMLVAALALLLLPLLRPPVSALVDEEQALLSAHRARLVALKAQRAEGALEDDTYADAREELEQRVLDVAASRPQRPRQRRPARLVAALVLVLVPAVSLWLYARLGAQPALDVLTDPIGQLRAQVDNAASQAQLEAVQARLARLLESEPARLEGWRALARARVTLGDYRGAVEATDRALALSDGATEDLIDYVEAASMANEMRFPEVAQTRIEQALAQAPTHPKALMLGALAAIQRGDAELAQARFRRLLADLPADSERARFLQGIIARIDQAATDAAASPRPDDDAGPRIDVSVSLDPALAAEVDGAQKVFVFARAPDGPPMPLAVVVLRASDLPAQVVLDDSAGMIPGRNLSSAGRVVIGARISRTGSATPASGDLEGTTQPLDPRASSPVQVLIDRRR